MITKLILYALESYAITFVVTASSLFEPLREQVKARYPWLQIRSGKHPVECRMCSGFWVAAAVCVMDYKLILPVYGLAYFLATQERK